MGTSCCEFVCLDDISPPISKIVDKRAIIIAVAALATTVLFCILTSCCYKRRKRHRQQNARDEVTDANGQVIATISTCETCSVPDDYLYLRLFNRLIAKNEENDTLKELIVSLEQQLQTRTEENEALRNIAEYEQKMRDNKDVNEGEESKKAEEEQKSA